MRKNYLNIKGVLLGLSLILLLVLLGISGIRYFSLQAEPELKQATLYPVAARKAASLNLIDQQGNAFTAEQFKGHWSLVFFGYTYCPDICPLTLTLLQQVYNQLPAADRAATQVVLVSVDPQRDTPLRLKEYLAYFNPEFIGLTGSDAELTDFSRQLGALYIKPDTTEAYYTVDHSARIFLLNPAGEVVALFSPPYDAEGILTDYLAINTTYSN